jgi:hypothetical protein
VSVAGSGVASGDPVALAHARLLADHSLQFDFSEAPPPAPPPSWLVALIKALGHAIQWAAPGIRIGFWLLLALGVGVLIFAVVRQLLVRSERTAPASPLALHAIGSGAVAAAKRAAALLADADRLAAEGRYDEAAHVLLLRGVEDVDQSRPGRIRPSFTSRDIAELVGLPPRPKAAFATIAQAVERSVFGGRALDQAAWIVCRQAYGALAQAEAWVAE